MEEMLITQKPCSVKEVIKTVFLSKEYTNKKNHKSFVGTERKSEGFLKAYFSSCSVICEPCKKSQSCLCSINVEENGLTGFPIITNICLHSLRKV